jgi:hypothetical protein
MSDSAIMETSQLRKDDGLHLRDIVLICDAQAVKNEVQTNSGTGENLATRHMMYMYYLCLWSIGFYICPCVIMHFLRSLPQK